MRIKDILQQEDGFTLIELMAVLAILTMLVLIAVPAIGSITKKAEAQADDATISMIEKAGGLALLGDVAYDDPEEEQYEVSTLVEEGYLDIDESHKYAGDGNYVTRIKGHEFEFEGAESDAPRPPATDASFFTTEVLADNTIRITGYTGAETDVVVPEEFDGKPVSVIGSSAFKNKGLTSVDFPEGLLEIGYAAFTYNNLTSVAIPDTIRSIGEYAFQHNELRYVDLPEGLTHIGNFAFMDNQLTQIDIPDSVTLLGVRIFAENRIEHFTFPASIDVIPDMILVDNPTLLSVTITNPSLSSPITDRAFWVAGEELPNLTIKGGGAHAEAFAAKHGLTYIP